MMDSACAEYDVLQTAVFGLHQQRVFYILTGQTFSSYPLPLAKKVSNVLCGLMIVFSVGV